GNGPGRRAHAGRRSHCGDESQGAHGHAEGAAEEIGAGRRLVESRALLLHWVAPVPWFVGARQPRRSKERAMCRWLAYTGSPIQMESVLFKAKHSLIDQSLH